MSVNPVGSPISAPMDEVPWDCLYWSTPRFNGSVVYLPTLHVRSPCGERNHFKPETWAQDTGMDVRRAPPPSLRRHENKKIQ